MLVENKPKCWCKGEKVQSDLQSYGLIQVKPDEDRESGAWTHEEVILRMYCCKNCNFAGFTYVSG